jgi:hypothetical protein
LELLSGEAASLSSVAIFLASIPNKAEDIYDGADDDV